MKKVLLVGSHSCSNRGDMAILRGLVSELKKSDLELTILSREYESSDLLYNDHDLAPDILQGEVRSFRHKLSVRVETLLVFLLFLISKSIAKLFLSPRQKRFIKMLRKHDFVIQVGGSFLVDHYGISQFEYILLAKLAKKRIYLAGHSYGPFRTFRSKLVAKKLLPLVERNFYREVKSKELLESLGIKNIHRGADTAWLINDSKKIFKPTKVIGMTLRDLYPFNKDLGVSQEEFEDKAAMFIDSMNRKGYKVVIYSTCTGFGGYWKDDRIVGMRVKKLVENQEMVDVFLNDVDDIELGFLLKDCDLVIGTRLHSAIIAMTFGTPAFTIYYEHKSLGIIQRVAESSKCIRIDELDSPNTYSLVLETLEKIDEEHKTLEGKLIEEQKLASSMIQEILNLESAS